VSGNSQLADDEDVQRRVECLRDLKSHRHAAPRQSENDDVIAFAEATRNFAAQKMSGLDSVTKSRRPHQ
jgi:hypothetical protein